ncbi:uncharacterized protein LOC119194819 isoform X2 [Pungitius pungitius]|uniref:uncharacterized protein LOC119194819 isoform X2 n=1 Tax=Pungitius pungitius TaxID=134920 RepID=UPI002E14F678
MAELGGIESCLFLIVMLQFAEAAAEQHLTVRDGDEVTLPCDTVTEDQNNCDSTEWFFYQSISGSGVDLVKNGQIVEESKDKSDRLSVSQKCSLVIKKVTDVDVGQYVCRRFKAGGQYEDALVLLSVVSMTEETNGDDVTLRCSVRTRDQCPNTVKWTNGGQDVDKDNKEVKTSQSSCSTSLSFKTSHVFYTSSFTPLKCEVTDGDKVMEFSLRNSPSGEDKTTTESTPTEEDTKADQRTSAVWLYVLLPVVLVVLSIIVVFVVKWKINKGNTTRTNNNNDPTAQPAAEARLTAGPEEGVSYATVSYAQKPDRKAQGRGNHGDDSVTYSTVKASSADPSDLYASIT